MMEVGHGKHNAQRLSQLGHNVEKCHGICAAGTRDRNALSRPEHLLFVDIFDDFFQHSDVRDTSYHCEIIAGLCTGNRSRSRDGPFTVLAWAAESFFSASLCGLCWTTGV